MKVYVTRIMKKGYGSTISYTLGVYSKLESLIRDLEFDMQFEYAEDSHRAIDHIRKHWGGEIVWGDVNYCITIQEFYLNGE